MGKVFSKNKKFGKIQDFSLPFLAPDAQKGSDELKTLEDEKNKALSDKKRFAVRLSEVEEILAKKSDRIRALELELNDAQVRNRLLSDEIGSLRSECQSLREDRQNKLSLIDNLKAESYLLRKELLTLEKSSTAAVELAESETENSVLLSQPMGSVDFLESSQSQMRGPLSTIKLLKLLEDKDLINTSYMKKIEQLQEEIIMLKKHASKSKAFSNQCEPSSCEQSKSLSFHRMDTDHSRSMENSSDLLESTELIYTGKTDSLQE